jgi:hypothetical protein
MVLLQAANRSDHDQLGRRRKFGRKLLRLAQLLCRRSPSILNAENRARDRRNADADMTRGIGVASLNLNGIRGSAPTVPGKDSDVVELRGAHASRDRRLGGTEAVRRGDWVLWPASRRAEPRQVRESEPGQLIPTRIARGRETVRRFDTDDLASLQDGQSSTRRRRIIPA